MKIDKDYLASITGKVIKFNDTITLWESYAEPGMCAVIIKWQFDNDHESVHKIWVDFEPFEVENHKRQNANYYDENGKACLTAVEAGYYTPKYEFYIDSDTSQLPFEVVE